jgi:hypothetical protein
MQLLEIQEMPLEELKANFMSIMTEIVERHGDNKDDRQQAAESTDSKARD